MREQPKNWSVLAEYRVVLTADPSVGKRPAPMRQDQADGAAAFGREHVEIDADLGEDEAAGAGGQGQYHAEQLAACDGRETVEAEWIAPAEALRLAAMGERKVIFPTRMNLKLLAEASSGADAVARAQARTLVTVQPEVVVRDGARLLKLPPHAGYGVVEEPLENVM